MASPDPNRPTVLVTGASTGLGLAIARRLIQRDRYRLILTARQSSLERFEQQGIFSGPHVWLRPLDVTDAHQRAAVISEVERDWDGLHVLVNNAGVSYRSVVEHVTEEHRMAQLDINFRSPMELTRLALPGMRRRRRGRIINVSSVGGMMAMPTMGLYSASKVALEGACEALWYEVRPWNISVTLVQPGFINSDGIEKVWWTDAGRRALARPSHPYHGHYRHMTDFISRIAHLVRATPDSVAKAVLRTIERRHPPLRVQATADARIFHLVRRLMPQRLYLALLYRSLPAISEWGPRGSIEEPEEIEEQATEDIGW